MTALPNADRRPRPWVPPVPEPGPRVILAKLDQVLARLDELEARWTDPGRDAGIEADATELRARSEWHGA